MADQPGTLLQAMLAAGMPLNRAAGSLLMASGLQGHERSNGRDFLSNEQLIGGVKQGLNARDMGRTRWDPTTRRWMDGDQPYVSPGLQVLPVLKFLATLLRVRAGALV